MKTTQNLIQICLLAAMLLLPAAAQAYFVYPTEHGTIYYGYGDDHEDAITIGLYVGSDTTLVIPSILGINGKDVPVTYIYNGVFSGQANLTSIVIPDSVTNIGTSTFYGCTSLASVTLGNGITSIGENAFYECTSLASIAIPAGVTSIGGGAFADCASLSSITIPTSVTSIGEDAFADCTSLSSIVIPAGVTNIGSETFYDCTSLSSITIPTSVTSIGDSAFYNCTSLNSITIPDSVTNIGHQTFYECTNLTSVKLGNGVTSIEENAFINCTSLTNVSIGSSVTSIGDNAFSLCTSLSSIVIPDSVTNIGDQTFYYCTSLASATIGNGVISIGQDTFNYCLNLADVTIGNSVTSIGDGAFYGAKLSSIAIPDSVTNIGQDAFSYCFNQTNVTIPASVTSIGSGAFYPSGLTAINVDEDNDNYSSVDGVLFDENQETLIQYPGGKAGSYAIPSSVTNIVEEAFYNCYYLTAVTIPNSVTSIGKDAFIYCGGLTNVTIGTGVTSLEPYTFSTCGNLTGVYFQGNSPTPNNDLTVFKNDTKGVVYYLPSTTGWDTISDLFDGLPIKMVSLIVGSVDQLVGNVTVTHPDGTADTLKLGDSIQMGDDVEAPAGSIIRIVFQDKTAVTIGRSYDNSKLKITTLVYNPYSHVGKSSLSIFGGVFQYISGLIGHNNPGAENLGITRDNIGIRGTQFIVQQDTSSTTQMVYLIQGELAITPLATPGVTNICDAPVTIFLTVSNVTTNALDQATYDSISNQLFQVTDTVTFGSWLEQYFDNTNDPDAAPTADPSGDGEDNYSKFLAGMNPTNSASYFHILSATPQGNNLMVSWMCGGGRTNVLQAATNLGGSWSNVSPNIVLAGSGDSVTNYLDVGAVTNTPARFYRVQLVQ